MTTVFAKKNLYFEGNDVVSDSEMSSILHLETFPIYHFWRWFDAYTIRESREERVEVILRRYYRSLGYFSTEIEVVSTDESIHVFLEEKQQVSISKIHIDNFIKPYVKLRVGDLFEPTAFVESKKSILRFYHESGYCHARLDAKAYVDKEKKSVELFYSVDDGAICYVKDIHVEGIDAQKAKVILEHIELKKGQKFNILNIERSYRLIQGYGAFSKVSIEYDKKNRDKSDLDMIVKLTDNDHPRIVKFGVGVTSDVGGRVFASWRHQDLFHDMKVLEFGVEASQIEQEVSATYIHRSILPVNTDFLNTLDYNQYIAYRHKQFTDFLSDSYTIRPSLEKLEYVRALKLGLIVTETIILDKVSAVGLSTVREDTESFFLVAPFFNLDYDYRDSKIRPTKGFYLQNYIEYGDLLFGSEVRYLKVVERISKIESYGNFILAGTLKMGLINEFFSELPPSRYFYAGGSYSNRAYIFESLRTQDTNSANGGKSLLDASFNMIHPIYKNFDGVLFVDGTVLNEAEFTFTTPMVIGVGAGVSYNTVVGPVNVSAGMDPAVAGQYAIHFQVGYTF